MRKFNTVLLLLCLLVLSINAQDKKFLKWGSYQWELSYKVDTVYEVIVTSKTGLAGDPTEKSTQRAVIKPRLWLKDKADLKKDIGYTIFDTIYQLDPVTLIESTILQGHRELSHDIYAGKISMRDFSKLVKERVSKPVLKGITPGYNSCDVYTGTNHYDIIMDGEKLFPIMPYVKKGSLVVAKFTYLTDSTKESKIIGRVLFEIV